ncbi:oxygenase MpaB family protein [Gordonia sp. DT219]|uniref:oxygenase MpaB family protein n=1 Tax=Gordonia sp. DT219 TaxID=3416658 RepID=UPI003CF4101E
MTALMPPDVSPPHRFRAAPDRGRRIGRPLRVYWRLREPTEDEFATLGRRLMMRDEPAAAVVAAMRLPKDHPDRVSMRDVHHAIAHGVTETSAPALREFFALVEATPEWVDPELVEYGAQVFRRFGRNATDVLLALSLIGGYRFGGPVDLLAETGGLSRSKANRRLGETQTWAIAVGGAGGMRRGGDGWKLTVHVRLMHALVNDTFENNGRWDSDEWGLPINQTDLASTLNLFSGALMMGVRAVGVPVGADESRAIMHLWKYVGWLIGVDADWLFDEERDQHQLSYAILLAQTGVTDAGGELSRALVDAQSELNYRWLPHLAATYTRERLLSVLEGFLGPHGMRDLGLAQRVPWFFPMAWVRNTISYRVIGKSPFGGRYLEWRGRRARELATYRHFGAADAEVGALPI